MKKILVIIPLLLFILSSCNNNSIGVLSEYKILTKESSQYNRLLRYGLTEEYIEESEIYVFDFKIDKLSKFASVWIEVYENEKLIQTPLNVYLACNEGENGSIYFIASDGSNPQWIIYLYNDSKSGASYKESEKDILNENFTSSKSFFEKKAVDIIYNMDYTLGYIVYETQNSSTKDNAAETVVMLKCNFA